MAHISWNQALTINVRQCDEQHERITCLVNQLYDAIEAGKGKDPLGALFISLADQVAAHLADEENLLLTNGYPDLAGQKDEQERIVKQMFQDLLKQFQADGEFTIATQTFLRDWILDHIWRDRKLYGMYLGGQGLKPPAYSRLGCSITA